MLFRSYPMYVEYLAELAAVEADMIEESVSEEEAIRNKAKMERKEARMRVREIQRSLRRVDSEIEKYEQEKAEIMKYFFENPTDYAPPKAQRLEELKKELERLEREWLKLQDEIEAMSV